MPRTIPPWTGKTDDSRPPPTARLRIFEKTGGKCYICSQRLRAGHWEAEHKIPLWDGGKNEEGNLWPSCEACHALKTADEATQRAEARRHRMKSAGISRPKKKIPYRRADGTVMWRGKE